MGYSGRYVDKEVNSCFSEKSMTSVVKAIANDSRTENPSLTDMIQRKVKLVEWVYW